MADPLIPAARAAGSAIQMARAAASPNVMVKHGRREDRAAVYDRFIAACTVLYDDDKLTKEDIRELLVALHAVKLRAPRHVREAAERLFNMIVAVAFMDFEAGWKYETHDRAYGHGKKADPENFRFGKVYLNFEDLHFLLGGPESHPDPRKWKVIESSLHLIVELGAFASIARLDVTARWWHSLLTPWGKRWYLSRK
ncbi:hypothetical protein ACIQKB_36875 [Streptomyces sp. NPDC092046]|uniref:hypothetical protein n=1 Tax=Streptomyces sp. NPDC092046 TaxID=3366009 RepID=UPI0037F96772